MDIMLYKQIQDNIVSQVDTVSSQQSTCLQELQVVTVCFTSGMMLRFMFMFRNLRKGSQLNNVEY